MTKLNQTAINAAVSTLLKAHDKATEALAELLPLLKKTDRVQGRKALLPAVALHYLKARAALYRDIVRDDPTQIVFLAGWVSRLLDQAWRRA
jgi:hypothetical protein